MSDELTPDDGNTIRWFGTAGPAVAWTALGAGDVLITWRSLNEPPGGAATSDWARILYFAIAIVLLAVALVAGTLSYRNWRRMRGRAPLVNEEGNDGGEFFTLTGLFITLTLGTGMLWLLLPVLLIQVCTRADERTRRCVYLSVTTYGLLTGSGYRLSGYQRYKNLSSSNGWKRGARNGAY